MRRPSPDETSHPLTLADREISLRCRVNRRARRVSLRVDAGHGGVVLVVPSRRALPNGLAFARERHEWIRRQLDALPPRRPFVDGAEIPLLDMPHVLRHRPEARRGVWCEAGVLNASGRAEHVGRRVQDWLRAESRRLIAPKAHACAAQVQRAAGAITIRDPRTRWASCNREGAMSFSWRLVLAPEWVLDYVVAHEAAHLVEMNHGPAFWRLVAGLAPRHEEARRWLLANGARLHSYG